MKRLLCAFVLMVGCAGHSNFNHGAPHKSTERYLQERRIYRETPCEVEKCKLAYVRMSMYHGCSECALYFYRCRHLLVIEETVYQTPKGTIRSRKWALPKIKK